MQLNVLSSVEEFRYIKLDADVPHYLCACVCRECIPSGALTLDIALGGGFPKGRIIEVATHTYVHMLGSVWLDAHMSLALISWDLAE